MSGSWLKLFTGSIANLRQTHSQNSCPTTTNTWGKHRSTADDYKIQKCRERRYSVDEGRAVDVIYLDFSKALDTVCRNILTVKLRKCELVKWTVR